MIEMDHHELAHGNLAPEMRERALRLACFDPAESAQVKSLI